MFELVAKRLEKQRRINIGNNGFSDLQFSKHKSTTLVGNNPARKRSKTSASTEIKRNKCPVCPRPARAAY